MLQNEPLMFDRIQIGGIRRERQEITAGLLNQRFNAPAFVKRGMITNDDTPVGQRWQELFFSPGFEDGAVTVPFIGG